MGSDTRSKPTTAPELAPDESSASPIIRPEQLLRPDRSDARHLLIAWYVRKSAYPLLFIGTMGAYLTGRNTDIVWTDSDRLVDEVLSPLVGIMLAVLVRLVAALAGWVMGFRIARERERSLEPRTGWTSTFGRWLELRQVSRAIRAMRWTHHVRQEAIRRVAWTNPIARNLDTIFDVLTVVSAIALGVVYLFTNL